MLENFNINSDQINKINKITSEEKKFRIKNLELFKTVGFPNKRHEDWKFSDFRNIVDTNFNTLDAKKVLSISKKIDLLEDFEHNYIFLINGNLHSSNFNYEEKEKIKINSYDKSFEHKISDNPMICLNHALAENGYSLEIEKDYKFKKIVVIYNLYTKNLENKILNTKNKIKLKENSELHVMDYSINESKFINNTYEEIILRKFKII